MEIPAWVPVLCRQDRGRGMSTGADAHRDQRGFGAAGRMSAHDCGTRSS